MLWLWIELRFALGGGIERGDAEGKLICFNLSLSCLDAENQPETLAEKRRAGVLALMRLFVRGATFLR